MWNLENKGKMGNNSHYPSLNKYLLIKGAGKLETEPLIISMNFANWMEELVS